MLWHSTEESQGQAAFSKSPNLSTAYDLLSITTKGQTPLQSSSHPRARNPKEEVFRCFFSGNKAFGNLFVIFVNDNTCLMSELPFSLGPSYLFVSSVRSSNSHPDLLVIHHPTPLFQITPVLNTGLSLSEPLELYQRQSLDSICWLHGYLTRSTGY